MHIPTILFTLAVSAFLGVKPASATTATPESTTADKAVPVPWPHESSEIPPDPAVRYGALENGMRYAIMPHADPPGRLALRLHIDAGSLMEQEDQRGVAHFLEHMVFNGTRTYPDSSKLIPTMQRLGIAFGAHANAYTSFDETVYMLDLPNLDADTLDLAFNVMHDFADGALLEAEEIDKERGVILAEKRSRDSVRMRLMEQQFEFLLPDFLITHRFPIGTEEVISSAPRERFVDFYKSYYRPGIITFCVSGDIDADVMEKRIQSVFGALKRPAKPGTDPVMGKLPEGTGFRTAVFTDKEVASPEISIMAIRPYAPEPDTEANRTKDLPITVANAIIDRRFRILAKAEGAVIVSGGAGRSHLFNAIEFASADVTPVEGKWREAVAVLEQELRRAILHGFTPAELEEVKANTLNAYEEAVKRAPTRKSDGRGGLASQLASTINANLVFSTPADDLRIARKGIAALTVDDCHKALRKLWDTKDLTLVLTAKEASTDAKNELATLYEQSKANPVDPPKEEDQKAFAYTDFGPAGTLVSDTAIDDLGIRQLVLSNRIRVNLKRTDFEKNSISMTARFGGGKLTQPKDKTGLDGFSSMILNAGGLGQHSSDDLQRILAGRNVGADFGIDEDAFVVSGRTTPDDLELQLQLLCASLTDPGYRDEAVRQFRQILPQIFTQLEHTMSGAQGQMQAWLHGNDGRFAVPKREQFEAYDIADVKAWLAPALATGYLEFSMVGDFDPDQALPLILKTLGALPARADAKADPGTGRSINFPTTPGEHTFTYKSKIPKAAASVAWKIPGLTDNIREVRRFNVLADILGDRMRKKIREELGDSYSPRCSARPSPAFDFGVLTALSIGAPEKSEPLGKLIIEIAAALATEGSSKDEIERSVKPVLGQLEQSLRTNTYWLTTVLSQSQEQPYRLDWARQRDEDYKTITLEEINALAKKYLSPGNAHRMELQPVAEPALP